MNRKPGPDMRLPGESFCSDCPDHEACCTGYPCDMVRRVHGFEKPKDWFDAPVPTGSRRCFIVERLHSVYGYADASVLDAIDEAVRGEVAESREAGGER